jgi:predicted enzyme related to lactoylglutathione lyase
VIFKFCGCSRAAAQLVFDFHPSPVVYIASVLLIRKGILQGGFMGNPFVHVELNTPDPVKVKEFYSKLFDWKLEEMPNPVVPDSSYTLIKVGEGTGGGIMKQVAGGPAGWLAYVGVEDIQASTTKAQSLGGQVMVGVTEVQGMGWFSFIRDPAGAILGLWQTKAM